MFFHVLFIDILIKISERSNILRKDRYFLFCHKIFCAKKLLFNGILKVRLVKDAFGALIVA
jgi:hypothetical protein